MKLKMSDRHLIIAIIALIFLPIILSKSITWFEDYRSLKKDSIINKLNPEFKDSIEFAVSSTHAWQDTGIFVNKGDIIRIRASGVIHFSTGGTTANPDGEINPEVIHYAGLSEGNCRYLICKQALQAHTLVGRIGDSDLKDYTTGFSIGSDFSIVADKPGTLLLGFNDGFVEADRSGLDSGGVGDNSGSFDTLITIKKQKI